MSLIVEDLLYAACRIAGVLIGPGQTFSGDDVNDALKCLNSLIDSWKIQSLTVFAVRRNLFTVTPNQQDYTIGSDPSVEADFTLERPVRIEGASWFSGETEIAMRNFTTQQWKLFSPKHTHSAYATSIYYQPLTPNGVLTLWPIPTTAHQIALYSWQTIDQFLQSTDPVVLAPGYQRAIEYNLAVELAMRYPQNSLTPLAVSEAKKALGWVKVNNAPELRMSVDTALLGAAGSRSSGRYDIFSNRNI